MASDKVAIKKSAAKELQDIAGKRSAAACHADQRARANPRPVGAEKLSGTRDKYRIRQGNFRILYEINDDVLTVYVVKIGDRKDVHRDRAG